MDNPSSISILDLVLLIVLFLLSAFFSSSETALLSVNRFKMEKLAKEGNKAAQLVLKLLNDPQKLITTILIGNNLVNIAAASISTAIAIKLFGEVGVGIATLVVTILTIIFGEVLPKNLALKYPEKLALLFARFLLILEFLFYPFTYLLTKLISLLFPTDNENKLTEEELKIILEHGEKEGAIDKEEKERLGESGISFSLEPLGPPSASSTSENRILRSLIAARQRGSYAGTVGTGQCGPGCGRCSWFPRQGRTRTGLREYPLPLESCSCAPCENCPPALWHRNSSSTTTPSEGNACAHARTLTLAHVGFDEPDPERPTEVAPSTGGPARSTHPCGPATRSATRCTASRRACT